MLIFLTFFLKNITIIIYIINNNKNINYYNNLYKFFMMCKYLT